MSGPVATFRMPSARSRSGRRERPVEEIRPFVDGRWACEPQRPSAAEHVRRRLGVVALRSRLGSPQEDAALRVRVAEALVDAVERANDLDLLLARGGIGGLGLGHVEALGALEVRAARTSSLSSISATFPSWKSRSPARTRSPARSAASASSARPPRRTCEAVGAPREHERGLVRLRRAGASVTPRSRATNARAR